MYFFSVLPWRAPVVTPARESRRRQGETAPNIVQPGAPGEGTRTLTPEELEKLERTEYIGSRRPLHAGDDPAPRTGYADDGSRTAPKHTRQLEVLTRRIDLTQEAEIELMRNWLKARNEAAPELHRMHGHAHGAGMGQRMPGMLTEAQLKRLAAARGIAFDRLFLAGMIHHHQGAVKMVDGPLRRRRRRRAEIDAFARHRGRRPADRDPPDAAAAWAVPRRRRSVRLRPMNL